MLGRRYSNHEHTHYFVMPSSGTKPKRRALPRRGGRRAENKEKTKRQILDAALRLFSRQGFFETTTRQISREAKIAEGTLFNYFKTKEDLALYFFQQELAALVEWHRAQKRLAQASLPEKLFALIHRHLERISPYEDFIGAVYLRSLQPASKLNLLNLETQELNLRYLRFIQECEFGVYAIGLFQLAVITYWLQDTSPGKEKTLALLDRSLKVGSSILKKGGWEW
jgi:AcrR family transcriptional regulator